MAGGANVARRLTESQLEFGRRAPGSRPITDIYASWPFDPAIVRKASIGAPKHPPPQVGRKPLELFNPIQSYPMASTIACALKLMQTCSKLRIEDEDEDEEDFPGDTGRHQVP